eukprot:CAMPEP_0169093338 /NCGR_PEP_ID=MMETSP1015-20121227/17383_1 /TAXON_ID=342587 /ORGANISM="Karlodinium micrum, Strain CCMP2283" /LENGTH=66 /DNA_ID=CAMNT_0009153971 /DNA_START=110 /DNA_END=307 /DNA_ORIENTATION=+
MPTRPRHPSRVPSLSRSIAPMCLSLVLQSVLQALLADAARPTAREDAGAAIDFGKVQPKSIHRSNI